MFNKNRSKIRLILVLTALLFSACARSETSESADAVAQTNEQGKADAARQLLANGDEVINTTPIGVKSQISEPKNSWYNSEIIEMTDGYGNKTIRRAFKDDSRLTFVYVNEYLKGDRFVEVFGRNGQRRVLSAEHIDKVLTSPGSEIADLAGINYPIKRIEPIITETVKTPEPATIKELTVNPEPQAAPEVEIAKDEETPAAVPVTVPQKNVALQSALKNDSSKAGSKQE